MTSNWGTIASLKQPCREIQGNNDFVLTVSSYVCPTGTPLTTGHCVTNQHQGTHYPVYILHIGQPLCREPGRGGWRVGVEGKLAQTHSNSIKRCLKSSVRVHTGLSTCNLPVLSIPSDFIVTLPSCYYSLFCHLWIKTRCDKHSFKTLRTNQSQLCFTKLGFSINIPLNIVVLAVSPS